MEGGWPVVLQQISGQKVKALSLEGHASKAGEITIQAIFTTSGDRAEDAFFLPS